MRSHTCSFSSHAICRRRLDGGPRENRARPSINRLFRSAAAYPELPRYLGHAMTAREILAQSGKEVEGALWNAVRSLYESAGVLESLAQDAERAGNAITATQLENRAKEIRRQAELAYDFMHELVRKT